jgi:hypothetical protein
MKEDEIRDIVDLAVKKSITDILQSFGFEEDERKELKADFNHLRRWRKSVEQTQTYTFKIIITAIVSGLVGAVWLGFKAMLGK